MKKEDLLAKADISIDDFVSLKKEHREEYVYNLFSTLDSSIKIKKLFLSLKSKQLFDNDLISAGLLSSIIYHQESYTVLLIDFSQKNRMFFTEYQQNVLFNCAFIYDNEKMVDYLENDFDIAHKTLEKKSNLKYMELDSEGKIWHFGYLSDGEEEPFSGNYLEAYLPLNRSPLYFSIKYQHQTMYDWLMDKNDHCFNSELIEEIFIDLISHEKSEPLLFLIKQDKIKDIIEKSELVQRLLKEPTQYIDMKKEVKEALSTGEITKKIKLI